MNVLLNLMVMVQNFLLNFLFSKAKLKLCERRYTVLTQHVNIEMVSKAGPASVSNVLAKMNMK